MRANSYSALWENGSGISSLGVPVTGLLARGVVVADGFRVFGLAAVFGDGFRGVALVAAVAFADAVFVDARPGFVARFFRAGAATVPFLVAGAPIVLAVAVRAPRLPR